MKCIRVATKLAALTLVAMPVLWSLVAGAGDVNEGFEGAPGATPERWQPLSFGSRSPTRYQIAVEGGRSALRAEANGSGSALVWEREFDPRRLPTLQWEWKVNGTLPAGDIRHRDREDVPGRVYVLFPLDPAVLTWWERLKYALLRLRYGDELPGEALVYVWANRAPAHTWQQSTWSRHIHLLPVESGDARAGEWVKVTRDVEADYRAAFGRPAPRRARIGLMVDTDDTGGHMVSWFDSICLSPRTVSHEAATPDRP